MHMKTYKLTIQYDGTRYHGWQTQGNTEQTVQGRLQSVLSALEGASVEVQGAGRTDAGVHATGQVASVQLNSQPTCGELLDYCRRYLPRDIAVVAAEETSPRFHARLSARAKRYGYHIQNAPTENTFRRKYMYHVPQPLNLTAMEQAAQLLIGTHDFRSFCGLRRFKKSTVRTIYDLRIERREEEVCLSFVGDGFLNQMVRILTGTLLEIGLGTRSAEEITEILSARDRSAAGATAPPNGLYLEAV